MDGWRFDDLRLWFLCSNISIIINSNWNIIENIIAIQTYGLSINAIVLIIMNSIPYTGGNMSNKVWWYSVSTPPHQQQIDNQLVRTIEKRIIWHNIV